MIKRTLRPGVIPKKVRHGTILSVKRKAVPSNPLQLLGKRLPNANAANLLLAHGFKSKTLRDWSIDCPTLRREYRVSPSEALKLGFSISNLIEAGYTAQEYKAAGITAKQIIRALNNESVSGEINRVTYEVYLEEKGFTQKEIKDAFKR